MRPVRLFVLVLLAVALAGCASMPAPRVAVATPPPATDLDSLVYARPAAMAGDQRRVAKPTPPPGEARAQVMVAPAEVTLDPAAAFEGEVPYTLDTGDKLRVVVFGQDGLTNSYSVDSAGAVTMPLIGAVPARGLTPGELSRAVAERLRRGFVRDPHVAIEVELYRPFFILGEVTYPGQYPYVPHMSVENAVAIAGGFTPRAYRWDIRIDRPATGGVVRKSVPLLTRVRPGDTVIIKERWF
jgi:polysaccharide export outer membrane protein